MVEEFQLNSHLPLETETFYIHIDDKPIELKKVGDATSTFVYDKSPDRDYLMWEVDYIAYEAVNKEELKGIVIVTETNLEDVKDIYEVLCTEIIMTDGKYYRYE